MSSTEIQNLQSQIDALKSRNQKVETDKARETSRTRKISIIVTTYLIAMAVMRSLGDSRFYLNALIPTAGYFLSTLSIPWVEKIWRKYKNR